MAHRERFLAIFVLTAVAACSSSEDAVVQPSGDALPDTADATGETASDGGGETNPVDGSDASDGGGSGRPFPDSSATIAILVDQLPTMNDKQLAFAASHFVGTQKLLLPVTTKLRALNPKFLVLHYHLAMWQSAPTTQFILDGKSWSNDYPTVTTHEDWFWHDGSSARVPSTADGKLLMNVSVAGFQDYWATSLADQVKAGDYDGIFLDSASPALLQGETKDARLAATAVKTTTFTELGGKTWIKAWEAWIGKLDATLAAKGIPLIPNTGAFITSWDDTDYSLTAGIFSEGFAAPSFSTADWKASTNELLMLARKDKIMILQNYLASVGDLATRRYYLANYLLVKEKHCYLDYFAGNTLQWFPEWGVDLGAATTSAKTSVDDLLVSGVYRREFAKGIVLLNPTTAPVTVTLGATLKRVEPVGGGDVDATGATPGSVTTSSVTSIVVPAKGGEILLK
jgi:hypothetical protein